MMLISEIFPVVGLMFFNGINPTALVSGNSTTYDIVALDGSPYNNHKRTDPDDRFIWGYAVPTYFAHPVCPVLSEKISGAYSYLEIGIPFTDDYRAIDTKFNYHDELYQPTPWLKAYYSLNNWNNTQEAAPY